jgi:preprotein translocase subunit SecB
MTDEPVPAPMPDLNAQDAAMQPAIRILAQYVRDLSFENPKAPEALRGGAAQPQIELGVELNAQAREGAVFEVELKLTAAANRFS